MEPEDGKSTLSLEELLNRVRGRGYHIRRSRRFRWIGSAVALCLAAFGLLAVPGALNHAAPTVVRVGAAPSNATPPTVGPSLPPTPLTPSVNSSPPRDVAGPQDEKPLAATPTPRSVPAVIEASGSPTCSEPVLYAAPDPVGLEVSDVPGGFIKASRTGNSPVAADTLSYTKAGTGQEFTVEADLGTQPLQESGYVSLGRVRSTSSVNGLPAIVSTELPPPAPASQIVIVWKPQSSVTLDVYGIGIPLAQVQAIADGVVFSGGLHTPPTANCPAPVPVVEGAITRAHALSAVSGAASAKLVLATDLTPLAGIQCGGMLGVSCDPAVVEWAVLSTSCSESSLES
jgi:hypothetical protein